MRDVTERILNNLTGQQKPEDLSHLAEPCIIISYDLTPSRTALLDKQNVLGFGTDVGSKTSHTAIMARAMRIPAVVGLQHASTDLKNGECALLDGYNGLIILNPTDQTLSSAASSSASKSRSRKSCERCATSPRSLLMGAASSSPRMSSRLPIPSPSSPAARKAWACFAPSIFSSTATRCRTRKSSTRVSPGRRRAQAAAGHHPHARPRRRQVPVPPPGASEMNPFLGWRAIRFCLQQKDIFRAQLRAILRASAEGNVKMMSP